MAIGRPRTERSVMAMHSEGGQTRASELVQAAQESCRVSLVELHLLKAIQIQGLNYFISLH